jgi:hypothetical protein
MTTLTTNERRTSDQRRYRSGPPAPLQVSSFADSTTITVLLMLLALTCFSMLAAYW